MRATFGQENSPLPRQTVVRIVEVPSMGIEVMEVKPGALELALDIIKYLDDNEVPNDKLEARKNGNRATRYPIVDGILF